MIKKGPFLCVALFLCFSFVQGAMAAGEVEYVFEGNITAVIPVYMSGHDGDPNWIEGYNLSGDIFLGGAQLGTNSGQVTLLNPPMLMSSPHDHAILKLVNSFPGIGSYQITAQALTINSSTSPTVGDITFSWSGEISNGTDGLLNLHGLSVGVGIANIFTGGGTYKEVIRVRWGY